MIRYTLGIKFSNNKYLTKLMNVGDIRMNKQSRNASIKPGIHQQGQSTQDQYSKNQQTPN